MMALKKLGMLTTLTALLCGPEFAFADMGRNGDQRLTSAPGWPAELETNGSSVELLNVRFTWKDGCWTYMRSKSRVATCMEYDSGLHAWVARVSETVFRISCFTDRPCDVEWRLVAALPMRPTGRYDCQANTHKCTLSGK